MLKSVDKCYYIGKSHVTCDDFAACHSWGDVQVSIVADGCSSSKNSDIGSRLLTMELLHTLERIHGSYDNIIQSSFQITLHSCLLQLHDRYSHILGDHFLDCTVLAAVSDGARTTVLMIGDGAILMERKDGSQVFYRYDFDYNMPAYASYLLDSCRHTNYLSEVKGYDRQVVNVVDGTVSQVFERVDLMGLPLVTFEWSHDLMAKLALCTDGIESFTGPNGLVDWVEVGRKVLASKVPNAGFLQRRVSRILEDYSKESIFNSDDVSAVALVTE